MRSLRTGTANGSQGMITVRQIERHWEAKAYHRLFSELMAARPEGALRLGLDTALPVPAAAIAVIRLDELAQPNVKLYPKLVKTILLAQEPDGGWRDLVTSALCLRALLCGQGNGLAIERGMAWLAALQKSDGIWPNIPIRRMAADPYISALVLYQLAERQSFRKAIRLADAVRWFSDNQRQLDEETRNLWNRARVRCRLQAAPELIPSLC
jgi:hypothetical protein